MSEPLISVVISVYNSEKFITRTLDCVKAQIFNDFEIIVIDDGSDDNTQIAVTGYINSNLNLRIRLISQENKGIAGARNKGILAARGRYIAFLDHDDIWYSEKLKKCYEVFVRYPGVDLVCHNEAMRDGSGKFIRNLNYGPYVPEMFRKLLFEGNCLSTSATVIKRNVLLESGMFIEDRIFSTAEDYDLWLRLSKKYKFYFIREVLGEYIFSNISASSNFEKHYSNQIKVLKKNFKEYGKKKPLDFFLLNFRILKFHLLIIRNFLREKAASKAFNYFWKVSIIFFDFV